MRARQTRQEFVKIPKLEFGQVSQESIRELSHVEISSLSGATQSAIEGLKKAEEKTLQAAQNIASGALNPEDVVSLSLAATDFKANVAVLKTNDEMTKSLLDIVA